MQVQSRHLSDWRLGIHTSQCGQRGCLAGGAAAAWCRHTRRGRHEGCAARAACRPLEAVATRGGQADRHLRCLRPAPYGGGGGGAVGAARYRRTGAQLTPDTAAASGGRPSQAASLARAKSAVCTKNANTLAGAAKSVPRSERNAYCSAVSVAFVLKLSPSVWLRRESSESGQR